MPFYFPLDVDFLDINFVDPRVNQRNHGRPFRRGRRLFSSPNLSYREMSGNALCPPSQGVIGLSPFHGPNMRSWNFDHFALASQNTQGVKLFTVQTCTPELGWDNSSGAQVWLDAQLETDTRTHESASCGCLHVVCVPNIPRISNVLQTFKM